MLTATQGPLTVTRDVYNRLREEIVRGDFSPGQRLQIKELAERYQVSALPVREALNRLSSELLVLQLDQRGFRVSSMSQDELAELVDLRCHIDRIALRRGLPHADSAWEERLILAYSRLSRAPKFTAGRTTNTEWEAAHRAFHMALISACDWRWVRLYAEQLFDQADRYRHIARASRSTGSPRYDEHKLIMEAALAREVTLTIELLESHLRKTAAEVMKRRSGRSIRARQ